MLNIAKLKKKEIIFLATHRCKAHRVKYIEHPNCFLRENPDREKIGFLDIEASALEADWGIVLATCILDLKTDKMFSRVITKKELFSKYLDKFLIQDVIREMTKYDRLITYYGANTRFDIPFLRSRAVYHGLPFPEYGQLYVEDLYPIVKNKFKLSRNRLDNACTFLTGQSLKTRWKSQHWIRALQGDRKSLLYIKDHCEKDVKDLKRLYIKIFGFARQQNTSI